jgi:hypothetical protein
MMKINSFNISGKTLCDKDIATHDFKDLSLKPKGNDAAISVCFHALIAYYKTKF